MKLPTIKASDYWPPEWSQPLTITINELGPALPGSGPITPTMDLNAAAAYLCVTVAKLRKLCREHRVSHSRPDYRSYVFKRTDLDEFLSRFRHQRKSVFD
jgi:excisionase family DNA binding protein